MLIKFDNACIIQLSYFLAPGSPWANPYPPMTIAMRLATLATVPVKSVCILSATLRHLLKLTEKMSKPYRSSAAREQQDHA